MQVFTNCLADRYTHAPAPPPRPACCSYSQLMEEEGLEAETMSVPWPSWQSNLRAAVPHRGAGDSSCIIDQHYWTSSGEVGGRVRVHLNVCVRGVRGVGVEGGDAGKLFSIGAPRF